MSIRGSKDPLQAGIERLRSEALQRAARITARSARSFDGEDAFAQLGKISLEQGTRRRGVLARLVRESGHLYRRGQTARVPETGVKEIRSLFDELIEHRRVVFDSRRDVLEVLVVVSGPPG